jgi:hypothetical protein
MIQNITKLGITGHMGETHPCSEDHVRRESPMMAQRYRITNASQEPRCIVIVGGLIPRRTSSVSTDDSLGKASV